MSRPTIHERIRACEINGMGVILARNAGAYYVAHIGGGRWRMLSLDGLHEYAARHNSSIVYYNDKGAAV